MNNNSPLSFDTGSINPAWSSRIAISEAGTRNTVQAEGIGRDSEALPLNDDHPSNVSLPSDTVGNSALIFESWLDEMSCALPQVVRP